MQIKMKKHTDGFYIKETVAAAGADSRQSDRQTDGRTDRQKQPENIGRQTDK